jgi:hypothetical protein
VMYGDTSAPQLLQTRNRSGPLDMNGNQVYAPERAVSTALHDYGAEAATMSRNSSVKSRFAS